MENFLALLAEGRRAYVMAWFPSSVRSSLRLFLVYAINSTVFIRFFFKLVQCLYINEDSNPIENGLH